jgi:hypothetical protein
LWSQNLGAATYGQAEARGYKQRKVLLNFFGMNDNYD